MKLCGCSRGPLPESWAEGREAKGREAERAAPGGFPPLEGPGIFVVDPWRSWHKVDSKKLDAFVFTMPAFRMRK
jgi:hypothetical protein